jgi:hypothetical protein
LATSAATGEVQKLDNSVAALTTNSPASVASAQKSCLQAQEATIIGSFNFQAGSLGIHSCVNNGETIECSYVLSIDRGVRQIGITPHKVPNMDFLQ